MPPFASRSPSLGEGIEVGRGSAPSGDSLSQATPLVKPLRYHPGLTAAFKDECDPPLSSFEPGQNLGRYKIIRPLGMGAMGVVYLAEDPRIERQLAIKTVRLEGREGDVLDRKQRLLREAKAAGRLVHPHVVTLFDAGEEGDTLFLAFEFVKGQDLSGRLEAGPPFTLSEALRTVRQAADGLGYAHAHGIVHRDIKPSNLLLDERGGVKISDFGIAKMAGQATELTMTGSVVGSPHYLSPEQIRGEDLDGRSDIFSLGVVLYELLTRRRPFEAETLTSLIYQILNQEPPSLDAASGDATAQLNAVVRKMMAKDKNERYQSAAEVVADLGAVEKALTSAQLSIPAATFLGPVVAAPQPGPTSARAVGGAGTAPLTAGLPVPSAPTSATVLKGVPPPPPPATPAKKSLPIWILLAVVGVVGLGGLFGLWTLLKGGSAEDKPAEATETDPTQTEPAKTETALSPPKPGPREPGVKIISITPSDPVADPTDEPASPATRLGSTPGLVEQRPVPSSTTRPPSPTPTTTLSTTTPTSTQSQKPTQHAEVGPEVDEPAVVEPRPTDPRPEPSSTEPVATRPTTSKGKVVDTGMKLLFPGKDKQLEGLFVVIDGRNIGQALDWKERGGYDLPDPGEHRVVLKKDGREQSMTINARPDLPPTAIGAALIASSTPAEGGGSAAIRVREAIGLKVEPRSARVLVDGNDRGLAADFSGGVGKWLRLGPGRHTVSLRASGYKPIDFLVDVMETATEDKRRLPPFNLVKDGR